MGPSVTAVVGGSGPWVSISTPLHCKGLWGVGIHQYMATLAAEDSRVPSVHCSAAGGTG